MSNNDSELDVPHSQSHVIFGKGGSNVPSMTTVNNIILEQSTDILKGNMSFGDDSINPIAKAAIGDIISREKNDMRNAKSSSLVSQEKKNPFEKNTAMNANR